MGGTRFVGKTLVESLIRQGHEITLFTRGNASIPLKVSHLKGDRDTSDIDILTGMKFEIIIDSSGRNVEQTQRLIKRTGKPSERFIYISSAGVYKNTGIYPMFESSEIDISSRHYGKFETEYWLKNELIQFTSFDIGTQTSVV